MFKKKNNNKGFTILEVAVAMFIISLGIVGVLGLIHYNLQAERVQKHELIASQLAQEGLEIVRNKRDNNWLERVDWKTDIALDDSYVIDYLGNIEEVDSINDDGAKMYLNPQGFYDHSAGEGEETVYSRIIQILEDNSDNITVEALVKWQDQKGEHQYRAETKLYNWRK